jgi:hypothetical protein
MKDSLKRLLNDFLEETRKYRTEKISTQMTSSMPESYEDKTREATLTDLVDWLNDNLDLKKYPRDNY